MLVAVISVFSKPVRLNRILLRLKNFLEEDDYLISVLTLLVFIVIMAVLSIVFFSTSAAGKLEMITVVYDRAISLILYIALLCVQCLVLLFLNFPVLYKEPKIYHVDTIVKNNHTFINYFNYSI